jgi:hypothetical protein
MERKAHGEAFFMGRLSELNHGKTRFVTEVNYRQAGINHLLLDH